MTYWLTAEVVVGMILVLRVVANSAEDGFVAVHVAEDVALVGWWLDAAGQAVVTELLTWCWQRL